MNLPPPPAHYYPAPKYSLLPGWICLGVALGAVILAGPLGFFIAGPLAIVCIILAIIGMAKNNTGGGIALLLSAMIGPGVAFLIWLLAVIILGAVGGSKKSSGFPGTSTSTPAPYSAPASPSSP